jgi:pantetheine-phosphate adenylyltransferase
MKRAANIFDELIVAVYDHKKPTKSILFSINERKKMLRESLRDVHNVQIKPFSGLLVNFAQTNQIYVLVRGLRVFSDFEFEFRQALANKRLAPDIETMLLITDEKHSFLSGTTVREIASLHGDVSSMVPDAVAQALHKRFNNKLSYGDSYNTLPQRD